MIHPQYNSFKQKYPDVVLLFRVGDNYEAYTQDAIDLCNIVKVTLREGEDGCYCFFHANCVDTFLPQLVRAGRKVALCDELTESPTRPHKANLTDLDRVQCSPDLFDIGKYNVFFFEEQIGTIEESKGMWIARPHGVVFGSGALSKESALIHLLKVRNASVEKKTELTLKQNQISLF